jgi:hypothetical protein
MAEVDAGAWDGPLERDGLVRESTYAYATVRDSDGRLFTAMRRFSPTPGSLPRRLLVHEAGPDGVLQLSRSETVASDTVTAAVGGLRADGFALEASADAMVWTDGSMLSLQGKAVSPALFWYLRDPRGSMRYTSRLYVVSGRLNGCPVTGFAGYDEVDLEAGRTMYVDDPFRTYLATDGWCTWGSLYGDGTAEVGHVAFGPEAFGFAVRTAEDGSASVGGRVSGAVERDRGRPVRAKVDIDGELWEFTADDRARSPESAAGAVIQAEGRFARAGDERPVKAWFAAFEAPRLSP